VLSFTADEAWEHFARTPGDSIFLHDAYALPQIEGVAELTQRWGLVRELRSQVQKELEALRVQGAIGSALAAEVEVRTTGDSYNALASLGNDLRFVFITSAAQATSVDGPEQERINVKASAHAKCPRCWHYRADVGTSAEHPELCGRCVANLFGAGEPRSHA